MGENGRPVLSSFNPYRYFYGHDSSEKAVGDGWYGSSASSDQRRHSYNLGRYYGGYGSSENEKATGDASGSSEHGRPVLASFNPYRYFYGHDSSEKAVGDGYYYGSASSDQRRASYNLGRFYGYGSSEKDVGQSSDGYGNFGYGGWSHYTGSYYGSYDPDQASSIFAVTMGPSGHYVRNAFAFVGLAAIVYGASMHYFVRKSAGEATELSPIV